MPTLGKNFHFIKPKNSLEAGMPYSVLTFATDVKRYNLIGSQDKGHNDLRFPREFIVFDVYSGLLLGDEKGPEYNVKAVSANDGKTYFFGTTESTWMASSGLINSKYHKEISLSAATQINGHYIHAVISAFYEQYTEEDVKQLKKTLSEWVIKTRKANIKPVN